MPSEAIGTGPPELARLAEMRKTSVRELHIHTSELVREAEGGGVVIIERRGEPVAEPRPITTPPRLSAEKKPVWFARCRKSGRNAGGR
jgi:antitoxin (DNA-binding transcriptional repressor) of toxin-antitoxin stability system